MKKVVFVLLALLLITACEVNPTISDQQTTSWIFIANEGNYGSSNGSISMIDDFGNVYEVKNVGDVVQSLEVYENKLIVLVNNSHKIKIYDITVDGLSLPGIEIDTDNSSPREMVVVDDKIYFTNWNSQDVKIFNLFNYTIESSIPVGSMPEGIITDGTTLWVANSGEETVSEIDIASLSETRYDVGDGPQNLVLHEGDIYISRTFYDDTWNAFYGSSKIGDEIIINNYGAGGVCGGSVMSYNNNVYRSFEGGVAPLDENLNVNESARIGDYEQSQVYHVEIINDNIWFAITDYTTLNEVRVVDYTGNEIGVYSVGINPGDFAKWQAE